MLLPRTLHSIRRKARRALRMPALVWVVAVALLGVSAGAWWGMQEARAQARLHATDQLALIRVQLRELSDRYALFPEIASFCPCVADALLQPNDQSKVELANTRLTEITRRIRADVSYVLDRKGVVIASSNHASAGSFVGKHYARRPYFRAAMAGHTGRFVGIGLTSGRLGYYLARPVEHAGERIGVVAVKLELEALQRWLEEDRVDLHRLRHGDGADRIIVADASGVVFLSSEPAWRFRALTPLPAATRNDLRLSRAYADRPLRSPLSDEIKGLDQAPGVVRLPGQGRYVVVAEQIPGLNWRLLVLTPSAAFHGTVWLFTLLGLLLALSLGGLMLLWVLRELYQRGVLRAAIRDPLTGLYTRLYMNETVPRLIARHSADQRLTLGLVIFDIDHFKEINDRFGHIAGDRVLAEIGALLRAQCDERDIAIRLGGEELAVFHLRDRPGAALRLAERIRLLVQEHTVPWKQTQIRITLSGGVAERRPGEGLLQLLQRADRALYQAKRSGRNRVIGCDSVTTFELPPGLASQVADVDSSGRSAVRP